MTRDDVTPTAAQAYLAVDILSATTSDASDREGFTLRMHAYQLLMSALRTKGWTGRTDECPEYGSPAALEAAARAVASAAVVTKLQQASQDA